MYTSFWNKEDIVRWSNVLISTWAIHKPPKQTSCNEQSIERLPVDQLRSNTENESGASQERQTKIRKFHLAAVKLKIHE